MIAIIDIGSNSIRLSVYEVGPNTDIRQVYRLKNVVGLAGYVSKRNILSEQGVAEACDALIKFREALKCMDISETHVFATASLRNILNTSQAIEAVKRNTGFNVTVISGEEEAICDYMGATNRAPMNNGLLIDIGGGSTELVLCKNGNIERAASITVGSLNMYAKYVTRIIPTRAQAMSIEAETLKKLEMFNGKVKSVPTMCGVGGTMRALCKLNNATFGDPEDNRMVSVKNAKKLCKMAATDIRPLLPKILQVMPERIHTITPGLIILNTIIKKYGCQTILVSESGVREGYLIRNVLQKNISDNSLPDEPVKKKRTAVKKKSVPVKKRRSVTKKVK